MGKSKEILVLSLLFKDYYGFEPKQVIPLPGAGSGRRYYRLSADDCSCIGVAGENERDCRAFIELDKIFNENDIPVPQVFGCSADGMYYIQEDLGDSSLFDMIRRGEDYTGLVVQSMKELARMQSLPPSIWMEKTGYAPFSRRQVFWDLNYFKYEYLRSGGFDFDEEALEDDFERFSDKLVDNADRDSGFMFRDFQSRNIMVRNDKPFFIDFQGGRQGPVVYDAISFLWQAKACFSDGFRKKMITCYLDALCGEDGERKQRILESVPFFALFRTLQVLGAYGLRGLVERKAHFIESIPGALENLRNLLFSGVVDEYPELKDVCLKMVDDPRIIKKEETGKLIITVFSFSYKKGYPADFSGNGGGFMFDCRGMHNPGRYAEYKLLTGLDRPVIDFLLERGEVDSFCEKCFELVLPTVERYLKRGFTSLQLGFGCTGGQHRSVYCAEMVAGMLAERFSEACVIVNHREQGIKREL